MKKSSNKGFTLVELIIVIAILAIIMLIAIPNFSGIQQRMQVRADKATAAQIGKAVRIWYTEYNSDPAFKAVVDADGSQGVPTGAGEIMAPLETITGISGYVDDTLLPTSLRQKDGTSDPNQMYCVGLVGAGTYEKVVVSIATLTKTGSGTAADPYVYTFTNEDSVTLPTVNADGTTNLDSKNSPQYDGQFVGTDGVTPSFVASLAYMEP